jgi:hypothetical protein
MSDSDCLDSHFGAAREGYEAAAHYAYIQPILPFCPRCLCLQVAVLQQSLLDDQVATVASAVSHWRISMKRRSRSVGCC